MKRCEHLHFEDILYEVRNGVAWITINLPDKMNAFRGQTCDEIIRALNRAGDDRGVGAIVLANVVVPHEQLDAEVQHWAEKICARSPTAMAIAKRSFNADTAHQAGIAGLGRYALKLYYDTEESREGVAALTQKRLPDLRKFAN